MSISLVGTATASATTVTPPAHQAGDILVFWASHGGATTIPSLPSGLNSITTISNATATAVGARLSYKVATSSSDTSGTHTNATELICQVYRPSIGNTIRVGARATHTSTTATVTYPALTLADTSGNSWVVGFTAAGNTTQVINTAPTGMTNQSAITGSTDRSAGQDTNGGVSSWTAATANVTNTGSTVTATVELVLATKSAGALTYGSYVYQQIGQAGNPDGGGTFYPGNNYTCPYIKRSGTGNMLIISMTYDGGALTPHVTGAVNGSFGSPVVTALGGSGSLDSAIYVLPDATAGQETLTVNFPYTPTNAGSFVVNNFYTITTVGTTNFVALGAPSNTVGAAFQASGVGSGTGTATQCVGEFQYELLELCNVATSFTATSGSTVQSTALSPTIGAGSFTPPNNNSTGGNFIYSYFCKADQNPSHVTNEVLPGQNFTMFSSNACWGNTSAMIPAITQGLVQTTSAAINPAFTSCGETSGDNWNSLAIAIPISGGSGTAPTNAMQLTKMDHYSTYSTFPASGNWIVQAPSLGNLRALCCCDPTLNALTITDSEGNTYQPGVAGSGWWYLANANPNPNVVIYITGGATDTKLSWRFYDVTGANANPYDSSVAVNDTVSGLTTYTPSKLPAPTSASGIVFCNIGLGQGPGLAVTSPSGAVWDLIGYTGEIDADNFDNADIGAHYTYSAPGAQTWTFSITNAASNSTSGGFIVFSSAVPTAWATQPRSSILQGYPLLSQRYAPYTARFMRPRTWVGPVTAVGRAVQQLLTLLGMGS